MSSRTAKYLFYVRISIVTHVYDTIASLLKARFPGLFGDNDHSSCNNRSSLKEPNILKGFYL